MSVQKSVQDAKNVWNCLKDFYGPNRNMGTPPTSNSFNVNLHDGPASYMRVSVIMEQEGNEIISTKLECTLKNSNGAILEVPRLGYEDFRSILGNCNRATDQSTIDELINEILKVENYQNNYT